MVFSFFLVGVPPRSYLCSWLVAHRSLLGVPVGFQRGPARGLRWVSGGALLGTPVGFRRCNTRGLGWVSGGEYEGAKAGSQGAKTNAEGRILGEKIRLANG